MASAPTTGPPTPPTFTWTASPTSLPFLGIAAERGSRDSADANSKFSRERFPIESLRALGPALKCFLQKPEHASKHQEHHQPAQCAREEKSGEGRPLESELTEKASAVQHPMPAGVSHQRRKNDGAHALRDCVAKEKLQHRDEQDEH